MGFHQRCEADQTAACRLVGRASRRGRGGDRGNASDRALRRRRRIGRIPPSNRAGRPGGPYLAGGCECCAGCELGAGNDPLLGQNSIEPARARRNAGRDRCPFPVSTSTLQQEPSREADGHAGHRIARRRAGSAAACRTPNLEWRRACEMRGRRTGHRHVQPSVLVLGKLVLAPIDQWSWRVPPRQRGRRATVAGAPGRASHRRGAPRPPWRRAGSGPDRSGSWALKSDWSASGPGSRSSLDRSLPATRPGIAW